ncbi:hypothetical protein ABB37_07329 [Leptomonas pyrrhocoris]|uniref:Leucine-rich repeat protein n=1 Tax=Leptomonas pyrrhocoris TaxID=157538 RepID=A0A0M9FVS3_LEPPY|nr:hypothetical protein ABB37_07329 [Leptomonas pyrrhocoris]KPA76957.1 hypothetical protein ABB37_07329 [Leptomonas pyrrhocoris]|eukprot:XP_015655396.1 hypothetical protein ABB37_07329 [Leptomonas pyrrhocoris]
MQVDLRRRGLQSFNPAEFANSDEHLQLLLQIRQLDLSFNSLYTIRGLEGLTHLTVLNISNNGLRSLGGGLPLTLQELDASHNCLATLQNAALLPLQALTSLDVSFNELEDLRGVPNVTAKLAFLDVRSNRLGSLQGLEHCAELRTLHAEANMLREVGDVASLKSLSNVTAVFLAGNPILLRKRLLRQLRLLLPPSVDQDDVPTTAPPSSVRSSTAPPPSAPGTLSVCSLENSTFASSIGSREGAEEEEQRQQQQAPPHTSQLSSRPASVHQSGLPLAAADCYNPHRSAASRPPLRMSLSPTAHNAPAPLSTAGVGGDTDSPSCRRRALPQEHRLGDSPASASPERFVDPSVMSAATTTTTAGSSTLRRSAPPPGLSPSARPPTTSHTATAASVWERPRPPQQDRRFVSSERTSRGLSREELEEQLIRVMAERDAYRHEATTLRRKVDDLQQRQQQLLLAVHVEAENERESNHKNQQHSSSSDLMPSAFSDLRSTTLNSIPSRTVLSTDASHLKDASASSFQQQKQDHNAAAAAATRPSPRVLAVEVSAYSSSAASEVGEKKLMGTVKSPDEVDTTNSIRADPTPPPSRNNPLRKTATLANANDRRAVAALFMSKLRSSSSD